MLHHRQHCCRVAARRAVLEAFDVRADETTGQVRIFAERPANATPPRLGREVGLRRESHVNAYCTVFFAGDIAESSHDGRIA